MVKLGYRANFAARLAVRKLTACNCACSRRPATTASMIGLAEQARRAAEFLAIQRIYIDIRQVDVFDLKTLSGEL